MVILAILAVLFVAHMAFGLVYVNRLNKKHKRRPGENAVCVTLYLAFIWPVLWKMERHAENTNANGGLLRRSGKDSA
jgi:hypothetical protein